MDQELLWAGIDTSTRSFAICIVGGDGQIVREAILPADVTSANLFFAEHANLKEVALESGTTSLHPARALQALGYNVAVYPALGVQRFIRLRLNKTDANDARGLAEIARLRGDHVRRVFLRPQALSVLRSKLVIRERILKMRKLNEGALKSLLHAHGVRAQSKISSETSLRNVVLAMIDEAEKTYGKSVRELAMPLVELSAHFRRDTLKIEAELRAYAIKDEVCRRLMEIPGVGLITTISFVTAIADPTRFSKCADAGAYFGLVPRIWETGAFSRKRRITKAGSEMTRRHLHMAARSTMNLRLATPLQTWAKAIEARTNRKTAVVALARKLAVVMLALWKNGTSFQLEQPLPRKRGKPADYGRTREASTETQFQ